MSSGKHVKARSEDHKPALAAGRRLLACVLGCDVGSSATFRFNAHAARVFARTQRLAFVLFCIHRNCECSYVALWRIFDDASLALARPIARPAALATTVPLQPGLVIRPPTTRSFLRIRRRRFPNRSNTVARGGMLGCSDLEGWSESWRRGSLRLRQARSTSWSTWRDGTI